MRKNSFGQGLAILFVVAGILYVIGSIEAAREPKCIEAGCDNKQASGSSYCYLHKPYTGRPSNIQEILDDKNIVKLVYDNASHYSFRAVNWSYSKGDTYDAVCVILNGSTEKLVEDKFSVSTLKTVTLNKLYVALTRSKGDLYIVTQDEFETVKEKYYKIGE